MSLEHTVGLSSLGLTVLKVHVVCTRDVCSGGSTDLSHDGRSSSIGVDVGSLDECLLVGGATCQLETLRVMRNAY